VGVRRPEPKTIFSGVADTLRAADITLVNQEWPLNDRGDPWPGKTGKMIGSTPDAVEALTFAGVDVVGLANNHMMNYGAEGMFQTIEVLDAAGIAHAGAGADEDAAHAAAVIERNGTRVAVLSYTSVFPSGWEARGDRPGLATVRIDTEYTPYYRADEMPGSPYDIRTTPNPADAARLEADIRGAREHADVVIVMWHWGVSMGYQHLVPYQVELGHRAIDAGASLVVGHHPHTLQPFEAYGGGLICYSVAQFGFDLETDRTSAETVLLNCEVRDRQLTDVVLHPALSLPDGGVALVSGEDARPVIEWIKRLCRPLGTPLEEVDGRLRLHLRNPSLAR
jgi:poly-gamma-glutamate synthesis protein (capsule biosynthesis protein)